jgi:tetratricopeptide (TPR) repeat protein
MRLLAEARAFFEEGEFEKQLRACSRALEFNPHSAAAWIGQVRALVELGECAEANLWADKALESFPGEPELLALKAMALGREGQLDEAIALSDTATEQRGDSALVWLSRGDVLLSRREKRAEYCLEKALELARGDWIITWLAARVRQYHRQFALAMKLLQAVLETHGGRAVLWVELGECQFELGLAAAGERSFAQARQLRPELDTTQLRAHRRAQGLATRLKGLWRRLFS